MEEADQAGRIPLSLPACTAPPRTEWGTASLTAPSLVGKPPAAPTQRMGGNAPPPRQEFTPAISHHCPGTGLQGSGEPGAAEKARDTGSPAGVRGWQTKHSPPPKLGPRAAEQSPVKSASSSGHLETLVGTQHRTHPARKR